jgi:hypothetical protein
MTFRGKTPKGHNMTVTEHVVRTPRHSSSYLADGTAGATPIVFVHGWPELAIDLWIR